MTDGIQAYIDGASDDARPALTRVLDAIRGAAPGAPEKLRYGMPAVELAPGAWMHVGAWKHHLGVYPVPPLTDELEERILPYRTTTSTVNLPLTDVPVELIAEVASSIARAGDAR